MRYRGESIARNAGVYRVLSAGQRRACGQDAPASVPHQSQDARQRHQHSSVPSVPQAARSRLVAALSPPLASSLVRSSSRSFICSVARTADAAWQEECSRSPRQNASDRKDVAQPHRAAARRSRAWRLCHRRFARCDCGALVNDQIRTALARIISRQARVRHARIARLH